MAELWNAAQKGDNDKLRYLLVTARKRDIEFVNTTQRYTPLHIATLYGHLSCVKLLLMAGANMNCRSSSGSTPLCSASFFNHPSVVSVLIAAGAKVDLTDGWISPLLWAAKKGHSTVVKLLLDGGANKEIKDPHGRNALELAINKNKRNVVAIINEHERLETRRTFVSCLLLLPNELAELCGDFVFFTPERRAAEKRARLN